MHFDPEPHRAVRPQGTTPVAPVSGAAPPARRSLLRTALTGTAVLGAGLAVSASPAAAAAPAAAPRKRPTTAEEALRELAAGNRRWRTHHQQHPNETPAVRQTLTTSQHPFALVLGCVDSRVPPELVFDQGLGDLLIVRSAGQVLDEAVLGSLAYGVLTMAIPLLMVLGHQSCGAVTAAVRADESGEELPAHIQYVADQISPAIDHGAEGDARIAATVDANVRLVRSQLAAEPDLAAKVDSGSLGVVGARYELTTQRVHRVS
ncbi:MULTISPECIES: carbonic anhydrase [unclassified Streptomyces]|uniref:carbonic anhydrase n=1 Tax=unclassified Streptomyces TaxID=2593676 RepID=UPI002DDB3F74|nr:MULTISPECIES: carbonic anhydrase [unclassified Streptomyces]WSA96364.1 carbonic anhydrase [Streptomyces sp. NBC_01795]WSB80778.1 carbonic anhydrase [Streptomyces sp. NBC_01775]WSS11013.1 carbonic anhydrase [Streptomyces sp. NBC_01186]WSS39720.1 carbonic anhydrase [Streptomyces sp. NBC_01187]